MSELPRTGSPFLRAPIALVSLLLVSGPASANDSTYHPTPTGIEFTQNDDISLEREALVLSESAVEVRYEFFNHAPKEASVRMAFPLPEVDLKNSISADGGDPEGWHFLVQVDGKRYGDVEVRWRALVDNVDKAEILQRLRIPVGRPPIRLAGGRDCLELSIPEEDRVILVREGLVSDEGPTCLSPLWRPQAAFLWEAKFAPGKVTEVKHTYRQWAGSATWNLDREDPVCPGPACAAVEKFGRTPVEQHFYTYLFHTGGNWKGPIKTFSFRAEGPPESLTWVEAPFPVRRISDNLLTAELQDYKPLSRAEHEKKGHPDEDPDPESVRRWNETGEIGFSYAVKPRERPR